MTQSSSSADTSDGCCGCRTYLFLPLPQKHYPIARQVLDSLQTPLLGDG